MVRAQRRPVLSEIQPALMVLRDQAGAQNVGIAVYQRRVFRPWLPPSGPCPRPRPPATTRRHGPDSAFPAVAMPRAKRRSGCPSRDSLTHPGEYRTRAREAPARFGMRADYDSCSLGSRRRTAQRLLIPRRPVSCRTVRSDPSAPCPTGVRVAETITTVPLLNFSSSSRAHPSLASPEMWFARSISIHSFGS